MKKYIILLVAWALTYPVAFAGGGENMIAKFEKGSVPGKVVLRLANLEKQSTQIAVQSVDGTIWFSKYIRRKSGFATKLDLRRLPDGDYVLFVRNRNGMSAKVFSMAANDIAFFENTSQKSKEGQLITHFNDMGDLSMGVQLANLQNRPVSIQVVTMGYEQLFSNTISGNNGFAKSFNMSNASEGDYFVHVKAFDATVVQFFKVVGNQLMLGNRQRLGRPIEEMPEVEPAVEIQ